jgi:hypothetical protein
MFFRLKKKKKNLPLEKTDPWRENFDLIYPWFQNSKYYRPFLLLPINYIHPNPPNLAFTQD